MTYEFKIKDKTNEWDKTPISLTDIFENDSAAYMFAVALAKRENKEVRMNLLNSTQGCYARPPKP
jgi:hypothetical protein